MGSGDLQNWLPEGVSTLFDGWLSRHNVRLQLKAPRQTRLGDFSVPGLGETPTITLNTDLPPFQVMVTVTHELAHLYTWYQHGGRVKPHGSEWRQQFRELLLELARIQSLPGALRGALRKHARKPSSATHHDPHLLNVLRMLDGDKGLYLGEIPVGTQFVFRGRQFIKISDARTRCRCRERASGLDYHISKVAEVDRPFDFDGPKT